MAFRAPPLLPLNVMVSGLPLNKKSTVNFGDWSFSGVRGSNMKRVSHE